MASIGTASSAVSLDMPCFGCSYLVLRLIQYVVPKMLMPGLYYSPL